MIRTDYNWLSNLETKNLNINKVRYGGLIPKVKAY